MKLFGKYENSSRMNMRIFAFSFFPKHPLGATKFNVLQAKTLLQYWHYLTQLANAQFEINQVTIRVSLTLFRMDLFEAAHG